MLRIETQGSLADLKKRSYFVRNATIEELLLSNLKPEVRTAVDPVCDTLVTRSFVLSQKVTNKLLDQRGRMGCIRFGVLVIKPKFKVLLNRAEVSKLIDANLFKIGGECVEFMYALERGSYIIRF